MFFKKVDEKLFLLLKKFDGNKFSLQLLSLWKFSLKQVVGQEYSLKSFNNVQKYVDF